jgi:parallel beta-helix repeat protein
MIVIIVPTNVSAASTYYVDWDTGNDAWDGTQPTHPLLPANNTIGPWKTISHALTQVSNGDTIKVDYSPVRGPYKERITISKQVTLIGYDSTSGSNKPTIDGRSGGTVVKINSDYVTISGFNIKGSGSGTPKRAGIYLAGSSSNHIIGCSINNNNIFDNEYGIHFKYADENMIRKNLIYDNTEDGIYFYKSDDNTINKNEIFNSVSGSQTQKYGIHFNEALDNLIINNDNDIDNDGSSGIYNNKKDGIFFDSCVDTGTYRNQIMGNLIHDNDENGIHFLDSDGNIVTYKEEPTYFNAIYFNGINGIYLENSDDNTFELNEVYKNDNHGIYLEDESDDNTIFANTIFNNDYDNNGGDGLNLVDSDWNTIEGNFICNKDNWDPSDPGDQKFGVYFLRSNNNDFGSVNTVEDNDLDGMRLVESHSNTISYGNIIIDNAGGHGIYLDSCYSNSIIYDNDIQNHDFGIYLYNSGTGPAPNSIVSNYIADNNDGIYLDDSHYNDIIDNYITGQSYNTGITLSTSDNNDIEGNTCYDSWGELVGYGIYLYYSDDNVLIENDCTGNLYGIFLEDSHFNDIIMDNYVHENLEGIRLENSWENLIDDNVIQNNYNNGIHILSNSNTNVVRFNDIVSNGQSTGFYGVKIDSSTSNQVYNNNFIQNHYNLATQTYYGPQAFDNDMTSSNTWDTGSPPPPGGPPPAGGGNYWSDYTLRYPTAQMDPTFTYWLTLYAIAGPAGTFDWFPLVLLVP